MVAAWLSSSGNKLRNEKSGRTGGERGGKGREAAPTIVAWPLAIVAE